MPFPRVVCHEYSCGKYAVYLKKYITFKKNEYLKEAPTEPHFSLLDMKAVNTYFFMLPSCLTAVFPIFSGLYERPLRSFHSLVSSNFYCRDSSRGYPVVFPPIIFGRGGGYYRGYDNMPFAACKAPELFSQEF